MKIDKEQALWICNHFLSRGFHLTGDKTATEHVYPLKAGELILSFCGIEFYLK